MTIIRIFYGLFGFLNLFIIPITFATQDPLNKELVLEKISEIAPELEERVNKSRQFGELFKSHLTEYFLPEIKNCTERALSIAWTTASHPTSEEEKIQAFQASLIEANRCMQFSNYRWEEALRKTIHEILPGSLDPQSGEPFKTSNERYWFLGCKPTFFKSNTFEDSFDFFENALKTGFLEGAEQCLIVHTTFVKDTDKNTRKKEGVLINVNLITGKPLLFHKEIEDKNTEFHTIAQLNTVLNEYHEFLTLDPNGGNTESKSSPRILLEEKNLRLHQVKGEILFFSTRTSRLIESFLRAPSQTQESSQNVM